MRSDKILFCQAIGLVLSIVLLSGCESSRQAGCQQEKLKLQQTIDAQQDEIDKLQLSQEGILKLLLETSGELDKCHKQLVKVEKEEKNAKKPKKLTPEQVARFKKGLTELEAARQIKAKRMQEKAAAEADKDQPNQND